MPATLAWWAARAERAEVGGLVVGRAQAHGGHQVGDPAHEVVVERAVDDRAGGGGAVLAGVDEGCRDGTVDRGLEVGVVEDHERRLAAELEVHALAGRGRDVAMTWRPTAVEPVKETIDDVGVADEVLARDRPGAGDDVDDAVGGAGLGERLREQQAVSGVISAGLRTIVLPAAMAGSTFQAAIWSG